MSHVEIICSYNIEGQKLHQIENQLQLYLIEQLYVWHFILLYILYYIL